MPIANPSVAPTCRAVIFGMVDLQRLRKDLEQGISTGMNIANFPLLTGTLFHQKTHLFVKCDDCAEKVRHNEFVWDK